MMSRIRYGTFLDSLNTDKTELRSIGDATGADEVMCVGLLKYPGDRSQNSNKIHF